MTAFAVPENLAFDSYTALIDAINDWLDRSDLTGVAPQMIALAEARIDRQLSPLFDEATASVTVTAGAGDLPADFAYMARVSSGTTLLPQVGAREGLSYAPGTLPVAYSIEANAIRVWPECDCTLAVLYQLRLAQLSDANASNTMLSRHPDLYFFGAMMFAEGYLANDNRAATFKALFDEALAEARMYLTRQRFGGPLVPRVAFVP